jgi:hypothetical protein
MCFSPEGALHNLSDQYELCVALSGLGASNRGKHSLSLFLNLDYAEKDEKNTLNWAHSLKIRRFFFSPERATTYQPRVKKKK